LPWLSGGSAQKPRLGARLMSLAKRPSSSQQTPKKGSSRLVSRNRKASGDRTAPYTPIHQKRDVRLRLGRAAANGEVKLETIMKQPRYTLINNMWKSGHLHKHEKCVHCKRGPLKPLARRCQRDVCQRRCNKKGCQKFTDPRSGSPVFSVSTNARGIPLEKEAAVLHCAVWGVPMGNVPALVRTSLRSPSNAFTRIGGGC
jgi:hypothetical protein